MSDSVPTWTDWLWLPDFSAAEDPVEVFELVQADYGEDTILRLFSTMELRLAQSVLHFDEFVSDERVVSAVKSELNFLRSVLGEARLANLIIPPPSAFMKLLQNTLDRADWSETGQLRTLASAVQDVATRPPMLDEQSFPFRTWWKDLPQAIKDIPEDWTPFSLADEVIQSGLDRLETLHGAYDLNDNLRQLANELQGLQAECEASGSRLNDIEEELGKRLAESLAQL